MEVSSNDIDPCICNKCHICSDCSPYVYTISPLEFVYENEESYEIEWIID